MKVGEWMRCKENTEINRRERIESKGRVGFVSHKNAGAGELAD